LGTTGSKVEKTYLSAVPKVMKTNVTQKIKLQGKITINNAIGVSAPLETAIIVTQQIITCPIIHITGAIRNPK